MKMQTDERVADLPCTYARSIDKDLGVLPIFVALHLVVDEFNEHRFEILHKICAGRDAARIEFRR